jgi:hypothetical protein
MRHPVGGKQETDAIDPEDLPLCIGEALSRAQKVARQAVRHGIEVGKVVARHDLQMPRADRPDIEEGDDAGACVHDVGGCAPGGDGAEQAAAGGGRAGGRMVGHDVSLWNWGSKEGEKNTPAGPGGVSIFRIRFRTSARAPMTPRYRNRPGCGIRESVPKRVVMAAKIAAGRVAGKLFSTS